MHKEEEDIIRSMMGNVVYGDCDHSLGVQLFLGERRLKLFFLCPSIGYFS